MTRQYGAGMASPEFAPAPAPAQTIAYGDHPDQVLDWRRPAGGAAPTGTLVVVHGGFWRPSYDRSHAGAHAQALADHGHRVAVLEYRRMPGDWEAMAHDVLAGLTAVRERMEDGDPVVLVGHSAGGHLALWAAHQPAALGVAGVVSLAGCVDLALTECLGLGDGAAEALMGTRRADDRARWDAADPALLGTPSAAVRLVHGQDDDVVPLQVSRSYADRTGAPLGVVPGAGHLELIDPRTAAWRVGARAAWALVERH